MSSLLSLHVVSAVVALDQFARHITRVCLDGNSYTRLANSYRIWVTSITAELNLIMLKFINVPKLEQAVVLLIG